MGGEAFQTVPQAGLAGARPDGVAQEPANECEPDAVENVMVIDDQKAQSDERPGDQPPNYNRNTGGSTAAAGGPPQQRAQDAAAVHREAGQHVEQRQREV